MALLIRNQAAFVEQIARNDQERLRLQVKSEDWQRQTAEWQVRTEEWQRKAEERFDKIEKQLIKIEASLIQLPKIILQQLPKAVKKEIGFKSRT